MTAANTQSFNVFATLLHSHLAGYGIRVRHIRNGVELPPISVDSTYDFNYQYMRTLPKEVLVQAVGQGHISSQL